MAKLFMTVRRRSSSRDPDSLFWLSCLVRDVGSRFGQFCVSQPQILRIWPNIFYVHMDGGRNARASSPPSREMARASALPNASTAMTREKYMFLMPLAMHVRMALPWTLWNGKLGPSVRGARTAGAKLIAYSDWRLSQFGPSGKLQKPE